MNRRRFVTLVALSGAAALTAPLSRAAAPGPRAAAMRASAGRRPLTPAMRREIASQEKSLAEQLEAIRGFQLPPGSPMAFVFTPLRARRGR
jgi:hypothetical protein